MRTTLTLEDDLAAHLKARAEELGVPFKQIVNQVIREGLAEPKPAGAVPRTEPHAFGFKPGLDLDKMNQIVDQLEAESALAQRSESR